jgi:hypothetical protein
MCGSGGRRIRRGFLLIGSFPEQEPKMVRFEVKTRVLPTFDPWQALERLELSTSAFSFFVASYIDSILESK